MPSSYCPHVAGTITPLDSSNMTSSGGDVAVFWDYENCTPSSTVSGYDVMNTIRDIAHRFGIVKQIKAYLDLVEQTSWRSLNLRSELQSCGVTLADCPHSGKKEVADKMMIVDMLTYAIDTAAPSTLLLITGDRDFAYAISVLRLRKYQVVLVSPGTATPVWKSQASELFDWDVDVLGKTPAANIQLDPTTISFVPCPAPEVHRRSKSTDALAESTCLSPRQQTQNVTFQPTSQARDDVHAENMYVDRCTSPHKLSLDWRNIQSPRNSGVSGPPPFGGQSGRPAVGFARSMVSTETPSDVSTISSMTETAALEDRTQDRSSILSGDNNRLKGGKVTLGIPSFVSCDRTVPSLAFIPSVLDGSDDTERLAQTQLPVWADPEVEIPPCYEVLLRCLEKSKKNGHDRAYKDWLGEALLRLQPDLYEDSGAKSFSRYIDHAEALGIIICGENPNAQHGWVELRPEWSGRVIVR